MNYIDKLDQLGGYVDELEGEIENIKELSDLINDLKSYSKILKSLEKKISNISETIEDNIDNSQITDDINTLKRNTVMNIDKLDEIQNYLDRDIYKLISKEFSQINSSLSVIEKNLNGNFKAISRELISLENSNRNIERKLKSLSLLEKGIGGENISNSQEIQTILNYNIPNLFEEHSKEINAKVNNLEKDIQSVDNMLADLKTDMKNAKELNNRNININILVTIIGFIITFIILWT